MRRHSDEVSNKDYFFAVLAAFSSKEPRSWGGYAVSLFSIARSLLPVSTIFRYGVFPHRSERFSFFFPVFRSPFCQNSLSSRILYLNYLPPGPPNATIKVPPLPTQGSFSSFHDVARHPIFPPFFSHFVGNLNFFSKFSCPPPCGRRRFFLGNIITLNRNFPFPETARPFPACYSTFLFSWSNQEDSLYSFKTRPQGSSRVPSPFQPHLPRPLPPSPRNPQ